MDYAAYFLFDKPFNTLRAIPRGDILPIRDRMNLRDVGGNGLPDSKILLSWDQSGLWMDFLSAVRIREETLDDHTDDCGRKSTHVEFFIMPDIVSGTAYQIIAKPSGWSACRIWRYGEPNFDETFTGRIACNVQDQFWECNAFLPFTATRNRVRPKPGDIWRFGCFYRYRDPFGVSYFAGLSEDRPFASGNPSARVHDYGKFHNLYFDDEPAANARKLVNAVSGIEKEFEALDPKKTAALRAASGNRDYIAIFRQLSEQKEAGARMMMLSAKNEFLTKKAESRDFSVSYLDSATALKRASDFHLKLSDPSNPVKCSAARGECESFQLVISSTPEGSSAVSLKWEGERNMPGLEWGEVRDVTAFSSFQGAACAGSFSDIIMDTNPEKINIPYASYTPLFCRFTVPYDAQSGIYRGVFHISNHTGTVSVPVELKVYNFALPLQTTLPVAFSFFEDFYRRWYGFERLPEENHDKIFEFLLKYRISPNDIYNKDLYPRERDLKKFMSRGLNFCTLGYLAPSNITDGELDKLVQEYRERWETVKACGARDICFFYSYDELAHHCTPEKEHTARRLLSRFRKEFPGLKCLQTSPYTKELSDIFNIWIPTFDYLAESKQNAKRNNDDTEFWWYSADGPEKPYPNFFLGYPLMDLRVIMTLSWKYKVRGMLHWCINREWLSNSARRDAIEQDPANWDPAFQSQMSSEEVRRCGMGNYIYPAPDGNMYPSLRLENLRDGIEDYEYYALLHRLCDEPSCAPALRAKAEELLGIPPQVAKSVCDYSENPKFLYELREHVACLIEQILQNQSGQERDKTRKQTD